MARNKNTQILVDLIKLISSSPTDEHIEHILENVLANIISQASGGSFPSIVDLNHNPTTVDLPNNTYGAFRNTVSGEIGYYVNDNGVIKTLLAVN
jgi:hypothetical protein